MIRKKYLSDFIYGSMDGVITTISILSGVIGAQLPHTYGIILGISNLLSDGFSMGSSRYLSLKDVHESSFKAFIAALITFCSFVIVGMVPILPLIVVKENINTSSLLLNIFVFSSIAFLLIGYAKSLYTGTYYKTILETVSIGMFCGMISYLISKYLKSRFII